MVNNSIQENFSHLANVMTDFGKSKISTTENKSYTTTENKPYITIDKGKLISKELNEDNKKSKDIKAEDLVNQIETIIGQARKANIITEGKSEILEGMVTGLEILSKRMEDYHGALAKMNPVKRFFKVFFNRNKYNSLASRIEDVVREIKPIIIKRRIEDLKKNKIEIEKKIQENENSSIKLNKIAKKYSYTKENRREIENKVFKFKEKSNRLGSKVDELEKEQDLIFNLINNSNIVEILNNLWLANKNVRSAKKKEMKAETNLKELKKAKKDLNKATEELNKLKEEVNKTEKEVQNKKKELEIINKENKKNQNGVHIEQFKKNLEEIEELQKNMDKIDRDYKLEDSKLKLFNDHFEEESKISEELKSNKTKLKEIEKELNQKEIELEDLTPPEESIKTDLFSLPKDATSLERSVMYNIQSSIGVGTTTQLARYTDYQRRIIFGFSIGQKAAIKEMSKEITLDFNDIKEMLEGGDHTINMFYVAHLLETLIPQVEKQKADVTYINALKQLQSDLRRSLPIVFKLAVIARMEPSKRENELRLVTHEINQALSKMKAGDRLLIPTGTTTHSTLLSLKKETTGQITPTIYNTGLGVEQHVGKGLNALKSLFNFTGKEPVSMTYEPFHLKDVKDNLQKLMPSILSMSFQEESKIENMYKEFAKIFGKGTSGPKRKIQINGICSFQVLTEGFRHQMFEKTKDKKVYKKFKIELLKHVQQNFKTLSERPIIKYKSKEYNLHNKLLEDNQNQIEKTEQSLKKAEELEKTKNKK